MINHDLRSTHLKPRTTYETPVQHLNDLKWTSNRPHETLWAPHDKPPLCTYMIVLVTPA